MQPWSLDLWPDKEPLEHSVLNVALNDGLAQEGGGPAFSSDLGLTSTEIPGARRTVDLGLGATVPFPANGMDRMALPPAEARLNDSDMCIADIHTEGFCCNTDRDILDQYETFNGLPVYYGGDLYGLEDSEWDDPYALASAAYVEDYNFDVPEVMDLMVHSQSRLRDGSEVQQDDHTDMVPVCRMVSCVTWNGWDVFDEDSLTESTVVDSPNMDDYYHQVVSSDEEEDCIVSDIGSSMDFIWDMSGEEELIDSDEGSMADLDSDRLDVELCCDLDAGSVADLEWNTWDDACALVLQGEGGAFPPEAAVIQLAVVFRNKLSREEECDIAVTDRRIAMIPPVMNRHVEQTNSESVDGDACNGRLCLLYPQRTCTWYVMIAFV